MDKRNWKIVYTAYEGIEKKAIELVSKEMGAQILRDKGRYTLHVLACERETDAVIDGNAVVIGLYDNSEIIKQYISADEIKEDGYVVKVTTNRENPDAKIVLITANDPCAVFYGAVDFVDDYFAIATPSHGPVKLVDEIFDFELPDYYHSSAPAIKTRCVFTWGHPINDYRNYIENMARLKLNELIIWNDFVPLNAKEVVAYAHEFGIKVIWGFAWGWSRHCGQFDVDSLPQLAEDVLETYEKQYRDVGGDGIYFQSFTEVSFDKLGDKLIAELVTDFVNLVSGKLLAKYPDLFIQFGLHATSVKDHLDFIAKVDDRIEILWEDCGVYPYDYHPVAPSESDFKATENFTDQIVSLREHGSVGVLFKGFMVLDWTGDRFVHQAGPFVLGEASQSLIDHDKEMLTRMWRDIQSGWLLYGEYAHKMARHIYEIGNKQVTVGMAGQFAGGLWFAEALCAQMLWDCDKPYSEILDKVSKRGSVDFA